MKAETKRNIMIALASLSGDPMVINYYRQVEKCGSLVKMVIQDKTSIVKVGLYIIIIGRNLVV